MNDSVSDSRGRGVAEDLPRTVYNAVGRGGFKLIKEGSKVFVSGADILRLCAPPT